jgi:hypothetical protein
MQLRSVWYRPAHSANGHLHWWLIVAPLTAWRALARTKRRRAEVAAFAGGPPPPPPPPVVVPRIPARPDAPPPPPPTHPDHPLFERPWGPNEGVVRPRWERSRP